MRFYVLPLIFCVLLQTLFSESYRQWMRSHNLEYDTKSLKEDSDADGIPNGLEYVLGTNPLKKSKHCLTPKIEKGRVLLKHALKKNREKTEIKYLWSKDLVNYHASGEASSDGTIVNISESQVVDGNVEISSDVVQGQADSVFLKW